MAGQGQDIRHQAGEITGQVQMKKDGLMNQASNASQTARDNASGNAQSAGQNTGGPGITGQATNFLHQTGEQVKSMAHGAAEAVKSTLGMNTDDNSSNYNLGSTNNPSNTYTTGGTNNPSNTYTATGTNNPSNTYSTTGGTNHPSNPSSLI